VRAARVNILQTRGNSFRGKNEVVSLGNATWREETEKGEVFSAESGSTTAGD
jgi:hypothetical protein